MTKRILLLLIVFVTSACANQKTTPTSPSSASLADSPVNAVAAFGALTEGAKLPAHILHPVSFPMSQAMVVFPPRNEPNVFFSELQALYRDTLRRSQTTTYVDSEGQNVWLTEYFRFYLNGCAHEEAMTRTLREITTGTSQPVCGAERTEFPPRNLPNEFQTRLEATYRDTLRSPQLLTYVDSEGANVWIAQYLRFRLGTTPNTACGHAEAQSKVFAEIRGGGVQPPCGPRTQFGAGQYRVNTDIQPGRYYSDPVSGCYFERQRGFGGALADIIANEFVGFNAGQWIVDISASDAGFSTDGECGTWFNTPRTGALSSIPPGRWLVGTQISAGTYTAATRAGCYWERLRDFSGNLSGILANDFVSGGGTRIVSIAGSDAGFGGDDECGTWTRSSASTGTRADQPAALMPQRWSDLEANRNRNRQQNSRPQ
jgi:hypothetical protein